jgi:hypothetical protein
MLQEHVINLKWTGSSGHRSATCLAIFGGTFRLWLGIKRVNTHFVIDLYPKPEAVTLELVLIIQRLYNFQWACPITISYHGEFVSTISTVLYHLMERRISVFSNITHGMCRSRVCTYWYTNTTVPLFIFTELTNCLKGPITWLLQILLKPMR